MRVGRLWQILSPFKQRNRRTNSQRASRFIEGLESRTLLSSPGMASEYGSGIPSAVDATTPLGVSALNSSATTLACTRSSVLGGTVPLWARVSSPNGVAPDGTVTFTDRKALLGSAVLNGGVAELQISGLARGLHVFTAIYSGSANFNGSISAPVAHSVRLSSSVRLSVSTSYATAGQSLTLTAAISPRASRRLVPSGKVLFYSDGVLLGRGRICKNASRLITDKLPPGPHTITARYTGDANFIPSQAAPVDAVTAYGTVVDLLVVYTPAALASVGSPAAMNETIRQAVRDTNQAFINSHIPLTVRVVHARQVPYSESGDYDKDLVRMRWPRDGYLDEVPVLRNKYGADLVSLFAAPPSDDTLGIGYQLLDTQARGDDARGYSVVAAEYAAAPDYVLAHELGHNLGASHDVEQDDSDGAPADSHGYRFMVHGTLYHDIMSYDPGIVIPYFSNPQVTYLGVPTGTVASANSARVIIAESSYVAAYRPTKLSLKSTPLLLN